MESREETRQILRFLNEDAKAKEDDEQSLNLKLDTTYDSSDDKLPDLPNTGSYTNEFCMYAANQEELQEVQNYMFDMWMD